MAEQTTPQAGVVQAPTDPVDRVAAYFDSQSEDQEQSQPQEQQTEQPQEVQQPEDQAELTPDDIEVEQKPEQSQVDAFDIPHNGQQVKLSRDEVVKYAAQGFDYTRKTQAVAEKDRLLNQHLQRLAQVEQVHPQVQQLNQHVSLLNLQLQQAEEQAAQIASSDPLGYPAASVRVEQIRRALGNAMAQRDQAQGWVQQQLEGVRQERVRLEYSRIHELVPEWADPQKRVTAEGQVAKHFADSYGVQPHELASALGGSGLALATAYKAMKYDQLVKAKSEKKNILRDKPPVTVPGASNAGTAKADQQKNLRAKLKRSGSMEDAAELLLNRMG